MTGRARLGPAFLVLGLGTSMLVGSPAGGAASGRLTRATSRAAAVHVQVPAGWASRPLPGGGLTATTVAADLGAAIPAAPTFSVRPLATNAANAAALLGKIDPAPFVAVPTTYHTSLDGKPALWVQWTSAEKPGDETTRTLVVTLKSGSVYIVTLEAPAAQWTPSFPAFDRILASLKFTDSGTG